jgi:hypothetical protein
MLISAKIRVNPRRNFEVGRNLGANFFAFPLAELCSFHLASVMKADLRVW